MKRKIGKFLLYLLIAIFLILLIIVTHGCKTQQPVVTEKQETVEKQDSMVVWVQKLFPGIKMKDSIYFYSRPEIILQKTLKDDFVVGKKHKIVSYDSTYVVKYTIPEKAGGLLYKEPIINDGVMNSVIITFSEDSTVYTVSFTRKGSLKKPIKNQTTGKYVYVKEADDEYFYLDPKATIVFRKIKYDAVVVNAKKSCLYVEREHNKGTKTWNYKTNGWNN